MSKQPPPPLSVTKYSSRGSIYANEFGSEIVCEDIAGGVSIHFKSAPAGMTELCSDGRFILSNLRLLFVPPVDASVSKATSSMAWALQLHEVSYGQILKRKTSLFSSEKEFLSLHTKSQVQFSFRFKPVGGVAPVQLQRIKHRLDEALAAIQDAASKPKPQPVQLQHTSADRRTSLPPLPTQSHTPAPAPSSSTRTPPHTPLISSSAFAARIESTLVYAPAAPLPRCNCFCACHCTCKFLNLRAPVLVVAPPPPAADSPILTIQQAIALAAHNQRLDASKPRSVSVSVEYQQPSFQSQTAAAQGFASRVAGGGMAALMMEQQKAREGDLKLVNGASRGGIEELKASADSIAKIAKKISGLKLGDKQEGDAAVQELLQLGFIDPVTSASAGKQYFDKMALQISEQMSEDVRRLGGALPLIDLFCAYNHKRPLDPVSPDDFKRACERMSQLKDGMLRQRTMSSGAVIIEHVSVHAQARQRQKDLAEFAGAKERKGQGASAEELFKARGERSSFVLALEELKEAEQQGFLLRDDSLQGLRFYSNIWT